MGRKKQKKLAKREKPKKQSQSSSFSFNAFSQSMEGLQLKSILLGAVVGLSLPILLLFILSGNTDGIYVTVLSAGSLTIFLWAMPDYKLGLTGVFLFTQPLLIYLANTDYNYTKMIYSIFFISLLLVLWGIDWLRKREVEIDFTKLLVPGLAILGAALLSLINSRAFWPDFQHVVYLFYFIFLYLFLANTLTTSQHVRFLLRGLLFAGLGASIYAMLQYYGIVLGTPGHENGTIAIISSLGNKNYLAGFLSYLFIPAFLLLYRPSHLWDRMLGFAAIVLIFITIVAANSDSAWIAMLICTSFFFVALWISGEIRTLRDQWALGLALFGVLVIISLLFLLSTMAWVQPGNMNFSQFARIMARYSLLGWITLGIMGAIPLLAIWTGLFYTARKRFAQIATAVLVVLGIIFLALPPGTAMVNNLVSFIEGRLDDARLQDWWIGYEMFEDSPILGTGIGDYKREFLLYKGDFLASPRGQGYERYIDRAAQAHNEYVQILAEMGIVGTLAMLFLIFQIGWTAIQRMWSARETDHRWLVIALLGGIVAFMADSLFSFPLHLPANTLAFLFLLGALNSQALGDRGPTLKMSLTGAVGLVAGILILVSIVSVFAYRDFQADLRLDRGQFLYQVERELDAAEALLEESARLAFAPTSQYFWLGIINYQRSQSARGSGTAAEVKQYRDISEEYFLRSWDPFLTENTMFYLAVIDQENMNYEASLEHVERLLALDPAPSLRSDALQLRAINIYNLGEVAEGMSQLEELAERHPDEPGMRLTLANMYLEQWEDQNDDTFCPKGREVIAEAQNYIQTRLGTLNRLLNPQEDTNVTYTQYTSWVNEASTLENQQRQLRVLLTNFTC